MDRKRIVIDTDTGSDDAVAIVMALREPSLDVVAITTVAGNVDLDKATINALTSCDYAETYLPPVYRGASKPMLSDLAVAEGLHGNDGLGDTGTLVWSTRSPEPESAAEALLKYCSEGAEIVALGPLTNIALAIIKDPEAMAKCPHITLMGGQVYEGNVKQTAEFNIWQDAHAAEIVFGSGIPITALPIEACLGEAAIFEEDWKAWRNTGTKCGRFCADINGAFMGATSKDPGGKFFTMPDPTAVAVLARPDIIRTSFTSYTRVETEGRYTKGMLVNDRRTPDSFEALSKETVLHPHNTLIVEEVWPDKFKDYILSRLSKEAVQ
ncbi:MAG: nucleoside hydrolase [Oscillospiraceae bacterium]|nr:nucleoside hydrolase [Oscillospiraceae bacterium]